MNKGNTFWLALIGGLLLLSVAVSLYFMGDAGSHAIVTQNGVVVAEIDLQDADLPCSFEVDGPCHNIIEVEPGRIRVADATCPDRVCVETGWIKDGTRPIVCLPGKLIIEITDGEGTADVAAK